jgi:hypothetical protein
VREATYDTIKVQTVVKQKNTSLRHERQPPHTRQHVPRRSDRLQSVHDKVYTYRELTPLTRLRDGLEKMQFPAVPKALAFPRC